MLLLRVYVLSICNDSLVQRLSFGTITQVLIMWNMVLLFLPNFICIFMRNETHWDSGNKKQSSLLYAESLGVHIYIHILAGQIAIS
jgi:hypothetical protein